MQAGNLEDLEGVDQIPRFSDLCIYPASENLREYIKPTKYSYDDDLWCSGPFLVSHLATFKLSLRMEAGAVEKRLDNFLASIQSDEYSSSCSLTVEGGNLKIFSSDFKDVLDSLPLHTIRVPPKADSRENLFYFLVYSDPAWCDLYIFKTTTIVECKRIISFLRKAVNDNLMNYTLNQAQTTSASEFCGHSADDDIACFTSHSALAILFRTHFARLESFVFKLRCTKLKIQKSPSNIRQWMRRSLHHVARVSARIMNSASDNDKNQMTEFFNAFEQCKICFELVAYCRPSSSFGLISDTDRNVDVLKDTAVKVRHPRFTERTRKLFINTLCPKERRIFYEIGWSQIIKDSEGIAVLLSKKKEDICDSNCQGDFCAFLLRFCCGLKFSEINVDETPEKPMKDSYVQTATEHKTTSIPCKIEKKSKSIKHTKDSSHPQLVLVEKSYTALNSKELSVKDGEQVKLLRTGKRWCKVENTESASGFVPSTSFKFISAENTIKQEMYLS
ncbi:hypothetical protein GJ496_011412 [Pomphorhynchus laevis]|nr:hypothetical protein GJ496_011412 [Pomphorhynchus laevis]